MALSFPRRKLLAALRSKDQPFSDKHKPSAWAVASGYARQIGDRIQITPAGLVALEHDELPTEAKIARKLLPRLNGRVLVRTSSATDEARRDGGGYLYFTEPDHRPFPTVSARVLIERGWLEAAEDGLFAGMSQTFRVPHHA